MDQYRFIMGEMGEASDNCLRKLSTSKVLFFLYFLCEDGYLVIVI